MFCFFLFSLFVKQNLAYVHGAEWISFFYICSFSVFDQSCPKASYKLVQANRQNSPHPRASPIGWTIFLLPFSSSARFFLLFFLRINSSDPRKRRKTRTRERKVTATTNKLSSHDRHDDRCVWGCLQAYLVVFFSSCSTRITTTTPIIIIIIDSGY